MVYPTLYDLYMGFMYLEGITSLGITSGIIAGTVLDTAHRATVDGLFSLLSDAGENGRISKNLDALSQLYIGKGGAISAYEPISDRDRVVHFMREVFRFEKLYGDLADAMTCLYPGVGSVKQEAYRAYGHRVCGFVTEVARRMIALGALQVAVRDRLPMYTYTVASATSFPIVNTDNRITSICHFSCDDVYNWFYVSTYDSGRYIIKVDAAGAVTTVSTDPSAYVSHDTGGAKAVVNETGVLAVGVVPFGVVENHLHLYDAACPSTMSWTPLYDHNYLGVQISALKWQGSRLYVFLGDGFTREWILDIWDFSVLTAPILLSHTDTVGFGTGVVRSVEAIGALLFCGRDTPLGWTVIDVSDPAAPAYIAADKDMEIWTCLNPYHSCIMATRASVAKYCRFDLSRYDVANVDLGDVGMPGVVVKFMSMDAYGDMMIAEASGTGFFKVYSLRNGGLSDLQDLVKNAGTVSLWAHVCGDFFYATDGAFFRVYKGHIV